jgi:integrase
MRQGELLGLSVDRVDFLRRTLRVDRQMVDVVGKVPGFGPTKTAASVRTIPVPSVVLEALTAHLQRFGAGRDGLVFTHESGGPIRRNRAGEVWRAAAKGAGVEGRSFHDLRHYCASVLIASGASVKVVQLHLGHAKAGQTLDCYRHLWPEDEDRTRTALESALRAAVSIACPEAPGREA